MKETIESYDEFLTLIESKNFNDNVIAVNKQDESETVEENSQEKESGLLALRLDVSTLSSFGDMKHERFLGIKKESYHQSWTPVVRSVSNESHLEEDEEDDDDYEESDSDTESIPESMPESGPPGPQGPHPPLAHATSTGPDRVESVGHPNPVVPGLFPQMDVNDERQFHTFDELPLIPLCISRRAPSRC
ncbi:Piso0_001764 [Millerozyma farinosa CBS 7064]|uniref:Piso0_001764 protein n=1 Tax=Pichia sorbitophila (strain ATCC MYA-4447 / BCRC 22081 / CBS 7064 / NBRC 10061 / NRRL Y-12695) TaxID=559304 RepID=G8YP14_PICSO|nr:Piso0_001764 [Millerozyma farinosa CBS 7064]